MAESNFKFEIIGLDELSKAFQSSTVIVEPIMQEAINKSKVAIDAQRTPENVPWITGNLANRWTTIFSSQKLTTKPDMIYARAVQFGMPPSPGRYVPALKKRLKNGPNIGMWPGFKGRFFMEKIMSAALPDIQTIFNNALREVTNAIAKNARPQGF